LRFNYLKSKLLLFLSGESLGKERFCDTLRGMFSGRITELLTAMLDGVAQLFGRERRGPEHLRTGRKGEEMAYYYLRRQGYTIVARNWRCKGRNGEIDLIGWEGKTLCFIEVKTRSTRDVKPAEAAVDRAKQAELRGMAALFVRSQRFSPPSRFDVVSIYLIPGESPEIELFKDAFPWRSMGGKRRSLL
jgi:putative endonuclease